MLRTHGHASQSPARTIESVEQRPFEQVVHQADQRIATILERMTDAIVIFDRQWRVTYITPQGEPVLQKTREALLGKILWEAFPEAVDSVFYRKYHDALETGSSIHFEEFYSSLNRWFEIRTYPSNESVAVHFQDITERKQIEEKLQKSEKWFRALIEKSADAIALVDLKGMVLYSSPSITRVLGYAPEELVGRSIFSLIHPDDQEQTTHLFAALVREPESVTAECRLQYKDGSWRWVEASGTNLLDEPGVEAIVINYRDITERKRLEDTIWKSEQQLQEIVDGSPAVIYLKDTHGHYMLINQEYERLFHVTKQQIIGKTDYDILPKEIVEPIRANDQDVLQAGRARQWEEVFPQDDGLHTYLSAKFPLFDPAGVPYAICGISTDITKRKLMEQRKDDFLSMASHELKTPLTTVKTYTHLLQKKFEKEDRKEEALYLSKMDTQINKLTKLIADLLDISKMQADKAVFTEEAFDFDELVREVVEALQYMTSLHQIIIEGTAKREIVGDKDRLGQVLINLISNAIKYSPQADKVIVRVSSTQDKLIVSVQDFGIGIPKHHQEKIFERFYRVSSDKEKTYPGLGIGLYIVHEIIQRHGGQIWVESTEGKGSTFFFLLPLKTDDGERTGSR